MEQYNPLMVETFQDSSFKDVCDTYQLISNIRSSKHRIVADTVLLHIGHTELQLSACITTALG